jgi:type IV pilus assembly protein PilB
MIIKRASAQELGKIAIEQGMKTLRMVALEKAREGLSTLEQTLLITSGDQ